MPSACVWHIRNGYRPRCPWGEIRSRGYGGGISILRDYLRGLRPEPIEEPVVRFEAEPGEQMQVDFCTIRRGKDRLSAFIAVPGYSPGRHRFHPCLRDFAGHHGFMPRLCRPYRAKTKGKAECFIQYLRHSFITPLTSRLKQAGLELDAVTANAEVGTWLRETANSRVHATTNRVPMLLLQEERPCLGKDMNKQLQRDLAVYEARLLSAVKETRQ